MELKKGYKQTDIGLIPDDWEVKKFTDCANLKHGFQFREEHFSKTGIKIIKIGNLKYSGELDLEKITFVPSEQLSKFSNFLLHRGDILMALTGATLGKTSIVNTSELLLQNYRVGNFYNKPNYSKNYIYYLLQSKFIQKTINKLVNEAAQPNLGKGDFDKFIVPIPPTITEQNEIVTALIDTDELINALQKLVEKKRNIKQGVMQELFRSKKGNVLKKLEDILEIKKGQLITEGTAINGDIPVIAGGKKPSYSHNKANRYNNTITISGSGANAGYVSFHETPIFASDCSTIEEGVNYSIKFIFYNLQMLQDKIYKAQTGGAQPHIHPSDLYPIEISFPDLDVQNSISTILTDMDNEIISLEKKIAKTKLIKQGMMQNLLTGKIRLV